MLFVRAFLCFRSFALSFVRYFVRWMFASMFVCSSARQFVFAYCCWWCAWTCVQGRDTLSTIGQAERILNIPARGSGMGGFRVLLCSTLKCYKYCQSTPHLLTYWFQPYLSYRLLHSCCACLRACVRVHANYLHIWFA